MPFFVTYSLRHTAITRLAMTGIDAPALQYWAGHKSLATTMKYIHMAADAIRKHTRAKREEAERESKERGPQGGDENRTLTDFSPPPIWG